ncbi:uncharacterized protein [Drosophila bipectinata]|uniref:uncharacterized protein n=1 Tax=Drosophila bipectinata TaxID=42026 RepID=UPI001C8AC246|nr:uncharacterized protein LOC108125193 [Drosophila bipectinata]
MEVQSQDTDTSNATTQVALPEIQVLNISGRVKPPHGTPRIRGKKKKAPVEPEAPKVNPTSFPVILSRILLKTNEPPENAPKINQSDHSPRLCFLCLEKPAARKRAYHMFTSTENTLRQDYSRTEKLYENRKDYKNVNNITVDTPCARALYRRVQKEFTDVVWNKDGNVFETDMTGDTDVWKISNRVYDLRKKELERLINFVKFLSSTKS